MIKASSYVSRAFSELKDDALIQACPFKLNASSKFKEEHRKIDKTNFLARFQTIRPPQPEDVFEKYFAMISSASNIEHLRRTMEPRLFIKSMEFMEKCKLMGYSIEPADPELVDMKPSKIAKVCEVEFLRRFEVRGIFHERDFNFAGSDYKVSVHKSYLDYQLKKETTSADQRKHLQEAYEQKLKIWYNEDTMKDLILKKNGLDRKHRLSGNPFGIHQLLDIDVWIMGMKMKCPLKMVSKDGRKELRIQENNEEETFIYRFEKIAMPFPTELILTDINNNISSLHQNDFYHTPYSSNTSSANTN